MLKAEKEFILEEVEKLTVLNTRHHELAHRMYQGIFNEKRLELIPVLFAEDFVEHQPHPGQQAGRQGLSAYYARLLGEVFPDLELEVRDMVAEDDKVICRYLLSGSHLGEFVGFAPSGRQLIFEAYDCLRIVADKITERWSLYDLAALMQQLDMHPAKA